MYPSNYLQSPRTSAGAVPRRVLTAGVATLGCLGAAALHAAVLNFEGLADGDPVGGTYAAQGVSFNQATALTSGISLNELDFPPVSGANVVSDDGGPISGSFATPVSSFSGYFTYALPVTLRGYDASNTEVVSVSSTFGENYVSSGNPANELLTLSFPGGLHSFRIEGNPVGSSFVLDDFTFTPVPEASSAVIVAAALGGFALLRRGHRSSRSV